MYNRCQTGFDCLVASALHQQSMTRQNSQSALAFRRTEQYRRNEVEKRINHSARYQNNSKRQRIEQKRKRQHDGYCRIGMQAWQQAAYNPKQKAKNQSNNNFEHRNKL